MARKKSSSSKKNNTTTTKQNRNLVKQILGRWRTQRKAPVTLPPMPTLSIDRVPSRNNANSLIERIGVNRLQRNLNSRGQTHRGRLNTLSPSPSPPFGGFGGSTKTPHQKNNARNALNSAENNKPKPDKNHSLKTRDDLLCKKRPDSKKARNGSGGSKKFVPWCK